ncbi:MAG: NAD-dependent epimerase/dehydratase family protein [Acidobacteria bacterium]|nr:NAD-dependent epimerase/dehydratase family protein [Acidobacteriota bacterium]MCB9377716.1 NAD-dependent epimerase/dehydratase family protein [Holophagales bacterium]
MLEGKRALVTGASGFVGSHLISELLARGAEVTAISRVAQGRARRGVSWIQADLERPGTAESIVERARPDVVFHLASAVTGRRDVDLVAPTLQVNLVAGVRLMVAASRRGVERVVLAGSMEEPDLAAGEAPSSPYAAAKAAQSLYARFLHAVHGLPVVIARIFMVYGPGQKDLTKLVPYAILEGIEGRAARLASCDRPIDWIFVEDVARGLATLAGAPGVEGESLDLGSGASVTVGDIAARIAAEVGAPAPLAGCLPPRPLETVRRADVDRTFERTGFLPTVGLDEGLARTIAWYRAERAARRA